MPTPFLISPKINWVLNKKSTSHSWAVFLKNIHVNTLFSLLKKGGGYLVFCEREGSQDPAQIISKFGGFPILHNFKKKNNPQFIHAWIFLKEGRVK